MKTFNGLPWYLKLLIFGGVALVFYAGFWFLITRGTRAETAELNSKIQELLPRNAQAQIASQRLNDFRAQYKARQEEYEELKALLPEQRELTTVLQGVQDHARNTGLSMRKFLPRDEVQSDFYSGKKVEVGVQSSFAGLRSFFDQMARYQRIVSITNLEIKQIDKQTPGRTVEAKFDITAYYASPEKLQNPNPNQQGGQAAPPPASNAAPAGAAPPAPAK
jgi:Tfp pilus assembly protein PilO